MPEFLNILVVCTGNSCRSPLAAAMLRHELAGFPVRVESAGTAAVTGGSASPSAQQVAAEMGLELGGHRAKTVDPGLLEWADLILVMERRHSDWISRLAPEAVHKVKFLAGYPDQEVEIPDPMGQDIIFYRQIALLMKAGVLRVARDIRKKLQKGVN
ncbi:MAG: low molecular weight protein arginine phosphatase [candidate division WOR-3 bacterium]|nr:low molecular weight protein arginine phosphatase [candidate division WOR-3 bacterium]